jgi:hypothetical protein
MLAVTFRINDVVVGNKYIPKHETTEENQFCHNKGTIIKRIPLDVVTILEMRIKVSEQISDGSIFFDPGK